MVRAEMGSLRSQVTSWRPLDLSLENIFELIAPQAYP
jgi:hypothetical protein